MIPGTSITSGRPELGHRLSVLARNSSFAVVLIPLEIAPDSEMKSPTIPI